MVFHAALARRKSQLQQGFSRVQPETKLIFFGV